MNHAAVLTANRTVDVHVYVAAVEPGAHTSVRQLTLMAVYDGQQWASLCRELDIASCGATCDEALRTLEQALREALDIESTSGVSAGAPVSDDDLFDFLDSAEPHTRICGRLLLV